MGRPKGAKNKPKVAITTLDVKAPKTVAFDIPVIGEKPAVIQGRPSSYTQELADTICSELAEGKSLRTVCLADNMPDKATVFRWLRTHESFCDQYTRAKEEAADALADEVMDIADDGTNDWIKDSETGKLLLNNEHVQRSKLRIETRKWIMAKMKPKKYGDKIDMTTNGKDIPAPIYGGSSVAHND